MLESLSDLKGLETLRNLRILSVADNCINVLSKAELESIDNITELNVSDNGLTTIEGFELFKRLDVLKIRGNKIDNIRELLMLRKLKKLHLSNSVLSTLKKPKDQKKNRRVIEALEGANVTITFSDD